MSVLRVPSYKAHLCRLSACRPAVSYSMSTMDAKAISGGEEETSGMRSETLGESGRLGEINRRQAIRIAHLIATLDLTFLFMQFGVMPVSMGCPASQHVLHSMPIFVAFQQSQRRVSSRREESVLLPSRHAATVFRVFPGSKSWFVICTAATPRALSWAGGPGRSCCSLHHLACSGRVIQQAGSRNEGFRIRGGFSKDIINQLCMGIIASHLLDSCLVSWNHLDWKQSL